MHDGKLLPDNDDSCRQKCKDCDVPWFCETKNEPPNTVVCRDNIFQTPVNSNIRTKVDELCKVKPSTSEPMAIGMDLLYQRVDTMSQASAMQVGSCGWG